ncbi:helicase [Fibrobacterales bacterium]|nr:helicase [Fibrobacterales bacterium]
MSENQKQYTDFAAQALSANTKTPQNIFFAEAQNGIDRASGYLTAALDYINENPNERILISTSSRNKQKYIWENSLPALNTLTQKLRPALLKERFSYICLRKFNDCINDAEHRLTAEERVIFLSLITWACKTKDGDLNEVLHHTRTPILWKKVACEPASCAGESCKYYTECHFQKAKKAAASSNLLIVNHQLFLQDLNLDFAILPPYTKAIFDDAGRLPVASSRAFARNLYFYSLRNAIKQNSWSDKWTALATESEKAFLALIKQVQEFAAKAKKRKFAYSQNFAAETGISPEPLQNALAALLENIEQQQDNSKDTAQFYSDIRKIKSDLSFLFAASHSNLVYWVESNSNPYQVSFNAEPLNASSKWRESFYPAIQSAFFTSDVLSTDSVNAQFDYFANCLGLGGSHRTIAKIFTAESPNQQATVVGIDFLPKPTDPNFNTEIVKTLCELLPRNPENSLVFCDFGIIQKLSAAIVDNPPTPARRLFTQGVDGNFYNLLSFFTKEQGSILLGTSDELKNLEEADLPANLFVALTRLPFPDIKDPVTEARQNHLKSQEKNAFILLTLPETTLNIRKLYAALSRFTPEVNGKRTIFITDSRLFTEQYGAKIQKALPNFQTISHRVFSNPTVSV